MNKKIKMHIRKYIIYDIFILLLFILISFIVFKLYNDYQENKSSQTNFSNYDLTMIEIYNINPNLFEFDENNTAIIEISDLLKPITNGKDTLYFGIVPLTKEQDQCVGYIIATKNDDQLTFDYSHICDMVDY